VAEGEVAGGALYARIFSSKKTRKPHSTLVRGNLMVITTG
jgi:hypothetical protein